MASDLPPGTNAYAYTPPPVLPGSIMAAPYQYTPLNSGQHAVAITTAQTLTLPAGAEYAVLTVSAASRYTTDGVTTPTASIGMPLAAGASLTLNGPAILGNFKIIGSGALLDIEYFK